MTTRNCQNCDVSYGPDDMFCENCGYDFITGSLPVDASGGSSDPSSGGAPAPSSDPSSGKGAAAGAAPPSILSEESKDPDSGAASTSEAVSGDAAGEQSAAGDPSLDVPRLRMTIAVDREFFDEVVKDGEIDYPDPVPADQELALAGSELHIGRTSESRAIHPDIDVADLTGDQAVSSRHAVLRVANDGSFTIVDVGSTNGTFLDAVDSEAILHGVPMEVKSGVPIYVGAWTRLTILD